jgi:hypothetical protein
MGATIGNRWIWVTGRDVYLDENGDERADLDPASNTDPDGWWTCHKDTRPGDLALLYRKAPRSDIAYLFEAASRPWTLGERPSDGVILDKRFDRLVDAAVTTGAISNGAADEYRAARSTVFPSRNIARKRGWRLDRLDAIQEAHDLRGTELAEREKTEGYSEALQADYDTWWAEDEALSTMWEADSYEEDLTEARAQIRAPVFTAAGWPEDTLVEDESDLVGRTVCAWNALYRFTNPLGVTDLHADAWLEPKWNALRANFKGSSFIFDDDVWQYVIDLAVGNGNTELRALV